MNSEFATALTQNERDIRDRFVKEYLEDYDQVDALIRCGYAPQYAKEYAARFMFEPYTKNRIKDLENEMGLCTENDKHKAKLIKRMYSVIDSPMSSGSAKVAAAAQVSKLLGLDAPVKTQTDVNLKATGMDLSHLSVAELEQIKALAYGSNPPVH